jgi:3-mercaptopyruvate sulfurtransferase SseA
MPTLAPTTTVDADWLAAHLHDVAVIDTRRTGDYLTGHVPGARSVPLDALLVGQTTRAALERLARAAQIALAARGIRPDDQIVLVDDADGSAALGALICELAGVASVRVLRGGIHGWTTSGHTAEAFPALPEPVQLTEWHGVAPNLAHLATIEAVEAATLDEHTLLLDTRSQLEHEGIVGTPCCASRGAIPTSTHLEWTAFLDMSGHAHEAGRIRALAGYLDAELDSPIIVTCHAGHRAAVAAHVLRSVGFTDVRVSLGSWHEWAARAAASGPDAA